MVTPALTRFNLNSLLLSCLSFLLALFLPLSAALLSSSQIVEQQYGPKRDPVEVFSQTAYAIKAVQFTSLFFYYLYLGPTMLSAMTLPRFVVAAALFGAGQFLNAAVYKAIGVNGVYYGTRLGKTVPWYHGFPFNSVPHPQYLGSALSFWGLALLLWNAPHHAPVLALAALVSMYYVVSSYVEAKM